MTQNNFIQGAFASFGISVLVRFVLMPEWSLAVVLISLFTAICVYSYIAPSGSSTKQKHELENLKAELDSLKAKVSQLNLKLGFKS